MIGNIGGLAASMRGRRTKGKRGLSAALRGGRCEKAFIQNLLRGISRLCCPAETLLSGMSIVYGKNMT